MNSSLVMKICLAILLWPAAAITESSSPPGIVVEIDDCGGLNKVDPRIRNYPRYKVSIDEDCDVSDDDSNKKLLAAAAAAVRESCDLSGMELNVLLVPKTNKRRTTITNQFGGFAQGRIDASGNVFEYRNSYSAWVKQRDIASLAAFVRKNGIKRQVGIGAFKENPFLYEGEVLVVYSNLDTMLSKSVALFSDRFVVTGAPTTLFASSLNWVIAGRGLGKEKVPGPYGGEVVLPALAFVDAMQTPQAQYLGYAVEEVVFPRHKCDAEPLTVIKKSASAPVAPTATGSSQAPRETRNDSPGLAEGAVGASEVERGLEQRLAEYLQMRPNAPGLPDQVLADDKAKVSLAYPADFEVNRGQGAVIAMLLAPSAAGEKTRTKISVTSSPTPLLNKNPSLDSVVASTIAGIRTSIPGAVITRPQGTAMAGTTAQVVMVQGVEDGVVRQKLVTMAVANQRILGVVLHATPDSFDQYAGAYRRVCDSYVTR